ncbi:MAG: DUF58 domain-containing protein [Gammaproteobacteria bacterium]|nr:DUF58 domain-containing protein [Gammaproteobacteria bacterium]
MRKPRRVRAPDAAELTLGEMMAMRPAHVGGRLMPGERFPTGMRPGRRRAQGSDLDSIGPYTPGDDIRWMDWRATARTGRAQMKRFVAESHIARMLIVDFRSHLFFGTQMRPMAKTAALLAAQLAWEAFILQEPVGLIVVPDGIQVRPRRGRLHVLYLFKHLEDGYREALARGDTPLANPTLPAGAIDAASGSLGSGDEICLFSDFGDAEALRDPVRGLIAIRQFRAIIVEDWLFHRPMPAGRYPYQSHQDDNRNVATIAGGEADAHERVVSELRSELRRRLISDGWRITEVARHGHLIPGRGR